MLDNLQNLSDRGKVDLFISFSYTNTYLLPQVLTCHLARVALPGVWPLLFIPTGQHGVVDWLGKEVGSTGLEVHKALERMVVEEGPVPLPEYITVVRGDDSKVFLGPSLTQPGRFYKKIEVVRKETRVFAAAKMTSEVEVGDEVEFEQMLSERARAQSDEQRAQEVEDETAEDEELHIEQDDLDDDEDDMVVRTEEVWEFEEGDAESRRARRRQRRRRSGAWQDTLVGMVRGCGGGAGVRRLVLELQ